MFGFKARTFAFALFPVVYVKKNSALILYFITFSNYITLCGQPMAAELQYLLNETIQIEPIMA